jgi:hypothetical protein
MHPLLEHASYNEAREHLNNRSVTGDDIREWFPHWCKGKMEYACIEGRPCERMRDGMWLPIAWIENA